MRIFAVDLERSGQNVTTNFTTQIGVCCLESTLFDVNDPSKCIVSTFCEYLPQPANTEWEDRCVEQFWKKNPELYRSTLEGIEKASDNVMKRFIDWIDLYKNPDATQNLLITDNSAFDFVCLAPLVAPYRSLLYLFGEYEQTPVDVCSYYLGRLKRNIPATNTWKSRSAYDGAPNFKDILSLTSHNAGDDAKIIGLNFLWVNEN